MAEAVERTDELVREYLLFRGFTHTLRQLDAEIKADKEKGFRVDKIVDQLQQLMQVYDLAALRDYWSYLERRLFSRLEDIYRPTINKLKTSLFRFYLVYTIQTNRNDKAQEFFAKQATELQNQAEWKDWFVLPFLPSPDTNPTFATYFSRQWADTFIISLHNFLSVLFQCMPVPVILNFDAECQRTNQVQEENEVLRQKLFALQAEIHRLKKEEQQQEEEAAALVQHKQPFIVLSQEEYGEHHSSIMHCRVDCSGRRVASLDVDGVIKVWSFNPIMQTKASSISKSPLLSLEWATKRDRLLLLGSGVGTVRLYDTEAKKNLCEININDDMPRTGLWFCTARVVDLQESPQGGSVVLTKPLEQEMWSRLRVLPGD